MKRGVMKITACCLAGAMTLSGNGLVTMAGFDVPLAGFESRIQEQEQKKETEAPVQIEASGYDTVAIAQVNEYVNIRDAASADEGNVLGKLYNNSAATILGTKDDWYLIQSGNVTGYVKAEFFVTGAQAKELAKEVGNEVATVNTTTLMVRSEATTDSEILALVGDAENLQVQEDAGDWVKVAVDSDVVGYVSKDYVECKTEFIEAESIEEEKARIAAEEAAYLAALEEARRADEAAAAAAAAEAAAAEAAAAAAAEAEAAAAQAAADAAAQAAADSQAAEDAAAAAEAQAIADAAARAAADAAAAAAAAEQQQQEQQQQEQEQQSGGETAPEDSPEQDNTGGTTSGLRQSIVNFALQFVGNPYVWGGTSLTNGADCSGFTMSVMANFGIGIPRVAAAQAGGGRAVDLANIQPGDLLFYNGSGGIGHVSMYIGNGQVVHASNSSTGIIVSGMGYRTPCSARSYID